MPNPRNPAPSSLSQNLLSARGVRGTPPARKTPSEQAARKASETKDAGRRAERAAKVAN